MGYDSDSEDLSESEGSDIKWRTDSDK